VDPDLDPENPPKLDVRPHIRPYSAYLTHYYLNRCNRKPGNSGSVSSEEYPFSGRSL
jgi:hypothetical protein